jgi:hypothetical protein
MTPVSVAVRLWAKTVALNAVFFGIRGMIIGSFGNVMASLLFLIGGFMVTLPLLMLITPLVRLSGWLPYSIPAKIGWLTFSLTLLIILIYAITCLIIDDELFRPGSLINTLMGTTIAGLLVAVLTTRRSLLELNTSITDKNKLNSSL